jgi:hypothetical protein
MKNINIIKQMQKQKNKVDVKIVLNSSVLNAAVEFKNYEILKQYWINNIISKLKENPCFNVYINIYVNYGNLRFKRRFKFEIDKDIDSDKIINPFILLHNHCVAQINGLKEIGYHRKQALEKSKINHKAIKMYNLFIYLFNMIDFHESLSLNFDSMVYKYKIIKSNKMIIDVLYFNQKDEDFVKRIIESYKKNNINIKVEIFGIIAWKLFSFIWLQFNEKKHTLKTENFTYVYFDSCNQILCNDKKTLKIDLNLPELLNELIECRISRYTCIKYNTSVQYQDIVGSEGFWIENNEDFSSLFLKIKDCHKIIDFYKNLKLHGG